MKRFKDLPLGTRFRYNADSAVFVILEHFDCGLVAKWDGLDGPTTSQGVYSAADSEATCDALEVIPVE
jgi:hypothetical protein